MLEIVPFTLGPAQTNAYLVADPESPKRPRTVTGALAISGIHMRISITLAGRPQLRTH
jgi:hypothetical protein